MRQNVHAANYAKLARPRLFNALSRPRLFARIDALRRSRAVIWVASPPGAGKTTLVATYLAASKAPSVWFQVDEGDADPASFFFFLGQTVAASGPALPWLAPELASDVPRFARLFFREYFARLPQHGIVVFDNVQELDWDRAGHLLEIAFSEVPEGITLIAVSRYVPPDRLARLELSGRVATLGWDDIRLDTDEATTLARLDDGGAGSGAAWLDKIDGWAAGIVMLREHIGGSAAEPAAADLPEPDGRDAVFRYFAGEIFGRLPPAWQRLLLLLSCLPGLSSADAQQLTGDATAGRLLGKLFRQRLFVDRRGPAPFTYHFHALFREFLQYEADRRLDPTERAALLERAGTILEARGRIEEAVRLYLDTHAYSQLVGLLLQTAAGMLATGRGQTWRDWLGSIPPDIADAHPRLRYCEGASLNQADPARAREVLARAEGMFMAAGDTTYRSLSIASIIESHLYEWTGFQALPGWIEKLVQSLHGLDLKCLDPAADVQIHSRLVLALSITDPESVLVGPAADRVFRSLPLVRSAADRMIAGAFLMRADVSAARELADALTPLVDDTTISPFHRMSWCRAAAYRLQLDGNVAAAQPMLDKALQLASDFGLEQLQFQLQFRRGLNLLGAGSAHEAGELIEQARRMMSPARTLERVLLRTLEACHFAQSGAAARARPAAQEVLEIGGEATMAGSTPWEPAMLLAYCDAVTGSLDEARAGAARAVNAARGLKKVLASEQANFLEVYIGITEGRSHDTVGLLKGLLLHRREQGDHCPMLLRIVPQVAQAAFCLSLREGVEVELVRRWIVERGFPIPDRSSPNWPWPIGVRAFGGLAMTFRGQASKAGGKVQKRPLMLLKALLAAGESGKALDALAAQLWPDAEDARASLNITLHRLRKLLGDERAVAVVSGMVVLDDSRIWADVRAFADLCVQAETMIAAGTPTAVLRRFSQTLLDLYRGPFCADDEESWLVTPREGMRRRFLNLVGRLGDLLEERSEWALARDLYTRALDAEPLLESSYRGLMRCAHAQRDSAAAFGTYRRCREILAIVLARAPSMETESLAVELGLKERQPS